MADRWLDLRLGDAARKIGSGATPKGGKEAYLDEGPFALIRSQNVYNDHFSFPGLAYINDEQARALGNVAVEPADILLNITGDSVARCAQVDPSVLPARVNQHVAIVRTDPSRLDARFLRYYLISPPVQQRLHQLASAGATRPALTKAMLESLSVFAPASVDEQRAIASILGALDDKIELNRKMSATLEAIARALFKSWFVDFDPVRAKVEGRDPGLPAEITALFPDSFEETAHGQIPSGWAFATISDIAMLNPEVWSRTTRPDVIRYVDLSTLKWGRFEMPAIYEQSEAPSRAQRVLRPGDTLVGTVRPANGSYGLVSDEGLTGSTGFAVLRPTRSTPLTYLAATSKDNIERLGHLADGGAYPAVRPEVVAGTHVVLSSNNVLRAFDAIASALLNRYAQADRESRTLAALRDALLPKLISGELRVGEAERILAASA
jgi:type I restriction enzyme S subunit